MCCWCYTVLMRALYAFPSSAAASCRLWRSRASLALRVYLTLTTAMAAVDKSALFQRPSWCFQHSRSLRLLFPHVHAVLAGNAISRSACEDLLALPAEPASRPPLSFTSTRSSGRYAVSRRRSVARSTPMQVIFSLFKEERCIISRLKSQNASRTGGAQTHEGGTIVRVCQY